MPPVAVQPPGVIQIAARGRAPTVERVGDLRYRARVRVRRDSGRVRDAHGRLVWVYADVLHNAVTVTNVGRDTVVARDWPGCFGLALRVWPARATSTVGPRAWDEAAWRPAYARAHQVTFECDFARRTFTLPPGKSYTPPLNEASVKVADVLGDSLPAGRYHVEARVRRHTDTEGAAPTLRLAAPDVVLRRGAYDPPLRMRAEVVPAVGTAGGATCRGTTTGARERN